MKTKLFILIVSLCLSGSAIAGSLAVLKKSDVNMYQEIFKAQKENQFKTARSKEKKLSNKLLMGYVLFDRYSSKKYKTSPLEIKNWMEKYFVEACRTDFLRRMF